MKLILKLVTFSVEITIVVLLLVIVWRLYFWAPSAPVLQPDKGVIAYSSRTIKYIQRR